jgi:hypothetical protein
MLRRARRSLRAEGYVGDGGASGATGELRGEHKGVVKPAR